jgi:L-rhamnose mutarotase
MKPTNFFALLLMALLGSCVSKPDPKVESQLFVYTTELKDDSSAIAAYEFYHSPKNIWPEINNAAKTAGFESITIHRYSRSLVMILKIPANKTKKEIDSLYAASSPKLKNWAAIMNGLQQGPPGAKPGETWVEMKEIYRYSQ